MFRPVRHVAVPGAESAVSNFILFLLQSVGAESRNDRAVFITFGAVS